jgi:cytochrome c
MCGAVHDATAQDSNEAIVGKSLYEAKCSACHSIDTNRTGPLHRGVVGRPIASVPGFAYSSSLKQLSGVWTPERLDRWLQNPQAMAAGSSMYFTVDDPVQRRQIIAYLSTQVQPDDHKK